MFLRKPYLTPKDGGGKCLLVGALMPADIIVSTTKHFVSRGIKFFTVSHVSHASMFIGFNSVVEATGSGVHTRSLTAALEDATLAVVYRRFGMTHGVASKVISSANKIGNPYDKKSAILAGFGSIIPTKWLQDANNQDAYYCSELIVQSFAEAGVPITDVALLNSTPNSLARSTQLYYVGHLKTALNDTTMSA
jgi:uncharacterized protein YycO